MGQKTHPVGFRLGFTKTWHAKWYANRKAYPALLKEDVSIRNAIRSRLRDAAIARIDIERSANQVTVTIQTAKPGVVIGKGGAKVEELRQVLGKMTAKNVKVTAKAFGALRFENGQATATFTLGDLTAGISSGWAQFPKSIAAIS